MSDEYDNNKSYQAQSSEVLDGSAGSINPDMDYVRPVSYTHLTLPTTPYV